MKLELLQENLNHALSLVTRIISTKPQMPILSHVLLKAAKGKLTLTASNLETSLITEVGAKVIEEGEFTLPGRTLAEIISSLSAEKVTLELNEGIVGVKSGSFKALINGIAASEFPKVGQDSLTGSENLWEIDTRKFVQAVSQAVFATASDESRAVLTGILFKTEGETLTLAATDGFRLSVVKLSKQGKTGKEPKANLIIPAKSLSEVIRILSEEKSEQGKAETGKKVKLHILEETSQVFFDLGETKIYSRLIAGTFPDFEKIIPSSSGLSLSLSVDEFSKAIRLASIFARESANIVKLKAADGKLKISANAPQVGENESEVDVKIEGKEEEFTIAFNYRYLQDYLGSLTGSDITVGFTGPTAPGVFQTAGSPNFLHIIMPVRVQG